MKSWASLLAAGAVLLVTCATATAQQSPDSDKDKDKARLYFKLGEKYYAEKKYEAALEAFQRAQTLTPTAYMHYNMGRCLEQMGRPKQAARQYERLLEKKPDFADRAAVEAKIRALKDREIRQPAMPAAAVDSASGEGASRAPPSATPIYKKWWFWTLVGAVVVGGVTVGVVAGTREGPPPAELGVWNF